MVQTIIELAYDDSGDDLSIIGMSDADYEAIKEHLVAIQHNMNYGVASTLYRVDDAASQSDIDNAVTSHDWHFDHGVNAGIIRGIEIMPGTPTQTEADDLAQRVLDAGGPDLTVDQPSYEPAVHVYTDLPDDALERETPAWANSGEKGAGGGPVTSDTDPNKSVVDVLVNDFPSIGEGNWRCVHPDHSSPEIVPVGEQCSLGHSDEISENDYAQRHRNTFDPTGFL